MDQQFITYQDITPFRTGNLRYSDETVPASFELEESRANQRILDASAEDFTRRYAIHARLGQAVVEAETRGEETTVLRYNQRLARAILREVAGNELLVMRIEFDEIVHAG